MTNIIPIKLRGRELTAHKAAVSPLLGGRHVLTNEPWTFVSLWLKRKKKEEALFYWEQAREFYAASSGLPLRSAPLLLYYAYMNAAKALLAAKGTVVDPYHGVQEDKIRTPAARVRLENEGVKIKVNGVVPSISAYFNEQENSTKHTLQELFFNMVFIHRTFCLTYPDQTDMFVPIRRCGYVFDNKKRQAFFSARLSKKL